MENFTSLEKNALLLALCETIPDVVFFKDPEGAYVYANHAFERLYGYTLAQIKGKTDYAFLTHEEAEYFASRDQVALDAGTATTSEAWQLNELTGERECYETVKTPVFDDNRNLMGLLGIVRNVTQLRLAEKILRNSGNPGFTTVVAPQR